MLAAMDTRGESDFWAEGLAHFNSGRFFECHEAWEEVWKRASGSEKLFYQGLIQAAVALLHAERGNLRGAASIFRKARAKLDPLPAEYLGIALGEFRAMLEEFFAAVFAGGTLPLRPRLCKVAGKPMQQR
jgi:predicted metal-dependent hydrolase